MENSKGKKIAMIIAFRDFRDEEYFIPKQILEKGGYKIITCSTSLGKAIGKTGGEASIDILIKDINVKEYEAILFIGGSGAVKLIGNEDCNRVAKETVKENKILGAICIAPAILAYAGVLDGKKATVWSSSMDKSAVKILRNAGADYQEKSVVVDGKIITGAGPFAAKEFANKIVELLF